MPDSDLTTQQLDSLRIELEQREQELQTHISQGDLDAAPVTLDQQSVGRVSRIDAIQQQQMARANLELAQQNLVLVQLALRHIESGSYGYCEACAESIGIARLQAQPFANQCLACQEASESN